MSEAFIAMQPTLFAQVAGFSQQKRGGLQHPINYTEIASNSSVLRDRHESHQGTAITES
jgi:hypothetical protein